MIHTQEYTRSKNGKISESLNLINKHLLIQFEMVLHIYFDIVNRIFFLQIILIDKSYRILILLR